METRTAPFSTLPRSATNTEIREISTPSDVWPAWNEAEVNLHMNLPESEPAPLCDSAGAVRSHPHHH